MANEAPSTPPERLVPGFTGYRDFGRAVAISDTAIRDQSIRGVVSNEVVRFLRNNRTDESFGRENEEYNKQAYRFFGDLFQQGLLNNDQISVLRRFGVPTEVFLSQRERDVRRVFIEEDQAVENLVDSSEKAATRSRLGRAFYQTSHIVRDLTTISKGERITEPKKRWRPTSRKGKLWNTPEWLYNLLPDYMDKKLEESAERSQTAGNRTMAIVAQAERMALKGEKFLFETGVRLAIAIPLIQSINALLMSTEVGTMPHAVSLALVAGLTFLTRGFPNITRESWGVAGKIALRGIVGGAIATGGMMLAETGAQAMGTSVAHTITPENFTLPLLATVTAGSTAARSLSAFALGKLGHLSGGTEDLIQDVMNRQGLVSEVSHFACLQVKGQLFPITCGEQAQRLAQTEIGRKDKGFVGAKKGWSGIAAYELAKDQPENLTPEMLLQAASELRASKTALQARLVTNPTRYKSEHFRDTRGQKHVITEKFVTTWLNTQMTEILEFAMKQPEQNGWTQEVKEAVARNLGLILITGDEVRPERPHSRHATKIAREARKMSRASSAAFVLGGTVFGAGWKALSSSENVVRWFHETVGQTFGQEVPINIPRALKSRAGPMAVSMGVPEAAIDPQIPTTRRAQQLLGVADRLEMINAARKNITIPEKSTQAGEIIRDSGFTLAEMDSFYQTLEREKISIQDLKVILQAAARNPQLDPWVKQLTENLDPNSPTKIAKFANNLRSSPHLRQDLSDLIRRGGLAVEIEKTLNNGRAGGKATREFLKKFNLDLDTDPTIQLGYLGLQGKRDTMIPGQIYELQDNVGKKVKVVLLGVTSPAAMEILPGETKSAERAITIMQKITTADPTELDRACNNSGVDFGKFVALVYDSSGKQPAKAQAALGAIRQETQWVALNLNKISRDDFNKIWTEALKGDPAAFNKLAPLLRDAGKKSLQEFSGEGLAPEGGATTVRLWQSVLNKARSANEISDRAAYYFQKLPDLQNPRVASVADWAKSSVETGAQVDPKVPTLGEVVKSRETLEDIGLTVFPQSRRPIPNIVGTEVVATNWQGTYFFEKSSGYPETFKRFLLGTEGAGGNVEYPGWEFLGRVGINNLRGQRRGGSGIATQIVDWLQEGKFGKRMFEFPVDPAKPATIEDIYRLAGAILADQVPPEMAGPLGLPVGEILPPVKAPGGIVLDAIHQAISDRGLENVATQLRQRVIAQVLTKLYSENELTEFYCRYVNLGNVGIEIRGFEAGSRLFFGKSMEELTVPEQAMLIGLAQNTGDYSPVWHPNAFVGRGKYILKNYFLDRNLITPEQYKRFSEQLDTGEVQGMLRKRFPITVDIGGGQTRSIDPGKITDAEWRKIYNPETKASDFTNPDARAVWEKGAKMIQMPKEFTNPEPEVIRQATTVDGFVAPNAPKSVQTASDLLWKAAAPGAKNYSGKVANLPFFSESPTSVPTITYQAPNGGFDTRPGVSFVFADQNGNILGDYNPSGVMGLDTLIEPGSSAKPIIFNAMEKALGVDLYRIYPAWKGNWALDGTDLPIQNPPSYVAQNSPRAVGVFRMSMADVLRGGGSNNAAPNTAMLEALQKDPDAWRKVTTYLKKEYNLTLYDGEGDELVMPPALLTNVRVKQGDFVAANARLLSNPNNTVTKILGDDNLLKKRFQVGPNPNETWGLSAEEQANLSAKYGLQKSGTYGRTTSEVGAMSFLITTKDKAGNSITVFALAKGQSVDAKGGLVQENLEAIYKSKAYGGIILGPVARKIAGTIRQ